MPRKLHIGGQIREPGWEVINAVAGPHVDHLGNAGDLSQFDDGLFEQIYASHVLEHFDYKDELSAALTEWHRVLRPGGRLFVSVPDLDILARLFLARARLTLEERYFVMRMIFGGHIDEYDYHQVGLNQEFLTHYLAGAGFCNMSRVQRFGLFEDTSEMQFKGVYISVNMVAEKPHQQS
jgi:predicted SAM-dependent methyltransferase